MPANRPGRVVYVQNTVTSAAINHGQPVNEAGFVGVAIKQVSRGWDTLSANQSVIDDDEKYAMIVKGKVLVDNVTGFAKGDPVYIIPGTNVLTETAGANLKFGRVTEIPLERGTPTGKVWIDLDLKP